MRKFSFTKADRILKRSEFIRLLEVGKKIQNRYFVAVYSPAENERSRLGITVSKRVGKAATRNRIKRFAREYFRLNRHDMPGYWNIHLIAKKEAAELSSKEAFLSLQEIFSRIAASKC
ncbi:MAG: ribonuclease P protein component [Deltaproteobacteria bacterium]|nr:ribonuclease P protein component [Deltaproteobacteria bacterium]MBW1995145.1 ribonuclease P protein component [Deltaproteobacteria bacterium]MBW2153032.1 ribonuclease P protein component [Deltaproteobacteria bacterium]